MRLRFFGPNMGYPPFDYDPSDVGAAGFNCVVLNLTDHPSLPGYIDHCHARGMLVVGRVVSGSLDRFSGPAYAATYYRALSLDAVTFGNELDGSPAVNQDGSWFQSKAEWEQMRSAFVLAFADSGIPLYGPGTVTGDPSKLEGYSLEFLSGVDNHLYTAKPETIWDMLRSYDPFDEAYGFTERASSEWGWPSPDAQARGAYVVNIVRVIEAGNERRAALGKSVVVAMLPYCWDRAQHVQPFFLNHPDCIREIRALGYGPASQPVPQPEPPPMPDPDDAPIIETGITLPDGAWIGPGVAMYIRAHGLHPIDGEGYFNDRASMTPCEEGQIFYFKADGSVRFVRWESAA